MTQNVPLDYEQVAHEGFFDAVQELLSGSAPRLELRIDSPTTITAVAGDGHDQASVSIAGRYRWRTTPLTVNVGDPGAAATTLAVFVTAEDNNFGGPPEDIDADTDYTFGLVVLATGVPVTPLARKVAELDWDGSAIVGLRQFVGHRLDVAMLEPRATLPSLTPLRVRGADGHEANLVDWAGTPGAPPLGRVNGAGGIDLYGTAAGSGLTIASTDGILVTGNGGRDTLSLASTAEPGITFGGDTVLFRAAPGELRTTGNLTVDGTLRVGDAQMGGGGGMALADGTATAPALTFASDGDTGLYRAADNALGVAAGGVEAARLTGTLATFPGAIAAQALTLGGDTGLYRSAQDVLATDDVLTVFRPDEFATALSLQVAGTDPRGFVIRADGRMEWTGPAGVAAVAQLYYDTPYTALRSGRSFYVGSTLGAALGGTGVAIFSDGSIQATRAGTQMPVFLAGIQSEAAVRFRISNDGRLHWGPGTSGGTLDTVLYRLTEDVLKTDDTFDAAAFRQGGTSLPAVIHAQGTLAARPAASAANAGFLYYASDEQVLYRSDGAAWVAWAGGGAGKYRTQVGDGSSTSINVDHNLNTRDVVVYAFETGGSGRQVFPEVQHTTANRVTLLFDVAPAAGEYTALILAAGAATQAPVTGVGSYTTTIGDGTATVYAINHNLGTRAVVVQVRDNATPYEVVEPDIEITSPSTVTLRFADPVKTQGYVVTILSGANGAGAPATHGSQHARGGSDAIPVESVQAVTAFGAGWGNYGTPFATAGFWTDPLGVTHLRGLVRRTSGTGTTIFTVPAGRRPAASLIFATQAGDPMTEVRIDILASGDVVMQNGPATVNYLTLDGIAFRAEA